MATSKNPSRQKLAPTVREMDTAKDYPVLLAEVKARIQSAQYVALRAVNKELVGLYWDIGRLIVERQQSEGWGKGVVAQLATDLRAAFPGVRGFSTQNLWYMRQFFQEYNAAPKLQPLVGEIGWAHNLLILSRCKDAQEREFYLRRWMCRYGRSMRTRPSASSCARKRGAPLSSMPCLTRRNLLALQPTKSPRRCPEN